MVTVQKKNLFLLTLLYLVESTLAINDNKKPNILLILADDVGTGDIPSYWNSSIVEMPNLVRLAHMGVTFRDAHSTPLCASSRYMLLSGNYAHRGENPNGSWSIQEGRSQFLEYQKSIAEVLRDEAGYNTMMVGKYHLGGKVPPDGIQERDRLLSHPGHDWTLPLIKGAQDIGFDTSYITSAGIQSPPFSFFRDGYLTTNSSDIFYWETGNYNMPHGTSKIGKNEGEGSVHWDSTAYNMILVNETTRFIDDHLQNQPNDPFFSYVSLGSVHSPHSPPNQYLDGSPVNNVYDTRHLDMLLEMDKVVGSLISAIEERNLAQDTIIIFTSDNGGLGISKRFSHQTSGPLKGVKGSIYEGGHRVPLIMRYDGIFPPKEERDKLVGLNDIYATICELVGIANIPKGSGPQDSVSFAKYAASKSSDGGLRRYLGTWAIKNGIIRDQAIRFDNFKFVHRVFPEKRVELYDLTNDLSETVDLSKDGNYTDLMSEMNKKLTELGPCPNDDDGNDYKGRFLLAKPLSKGIKKKVSCNWFKAKNTEKRCNRHEDGTTYCRSVCSVRYKERTRELCRALLA